MKYKHKNYLKIGITLFLVILSSILCWFIINRFIVLKYILTRISDIIRPITYGAIMAFLLAPVYNKSSNFLDKNLKKINIFKNNSKTISRIFASTLCLILILSILIALIMMLIPQIIKSISDVLKTLPADIDRWNDKIYAFFDSYPELKTYLSNYLYDLDKTINKFLNKNILPNLNIYISNVSLGFINIIKELFNFIIGLIVMIYLLNIKTTLSAQIKRILYSIFSLNVANIIIKESRYIKTVFSQFILGKIIDSIIIGFINYIFMSIINMKYPVLISVVIGVTNVVPFFGPFIGAIPSIFILLLISPVQSLQFSIWILILQQIDGNIIGPKILGQTTGLPSFWILFSILLFGGLFGIVGMVIGVPSFAIIYRTLASQSALALSKKNLSTKSKDYINLEYIDSDTKEYIKTNEEV